MAHVLSRAVDEVRRVGPRLQVLPVEQSQVVDEDVHHPQGERAVRSGPDRHPLVRLGGRIGADRVDHDQLRAAPARVRHVLDRLERVVVHAVAVLRPRKEDVVAALEVDLRVERPQREEERRVQPVPAGYRVELVVRGTERLSEALRRGVVMDIERCDDQFPRVFFPGLRQVPRYDLYGLLPADLLPLRIDADPLLRVGSSQGPGQSLRVVHVGDPGLGLAADLPLGAGSLAVSLDVDDLAVASPREDGTGVEAARAGGRHPGFAGAVPVLVVVHRGFSSKGARGSSRNSPFAPSGTGTDNPPITAGPRPGPGVWTATSAFRSSSSTAGQDQRGDQARKEDSADEENGVGTPGQDPHGLPRRDRPGGHHRRCAARRSQGRRRQLALEPFQDHEVSAAAGRSARSSSRKRSTPASME